MLDLTIQARLAAANPSPPQPCADHAAAYAAAYAAAAYAAAYAADARARVQDEIVEMVLTEIETTP
jgi:hypothetical protein